MGAKKIPFSVCLGKSKAFHTLGLTAQLSTLHYNWIGAIALNWLISYLTKRTQYFDCNGISSSVRDTETGVPHSSILSQLLFMIEMNDTD